MATKTNKEKIDLKALAEAIAKLAEALPDRVAEGRETIKSTLLAQSAHIRVLIAKKYRAIDIVQILKSQGFNITPKIVREVFAQVDAETAEAAAQGTSPETSTVQAKDKKRTSGGTNRKPKEAQHGTSKGAKTETQKPAAEGEKDKADNPQGDNDKNKGGAAKEQTKSGLFVPDEDSDFF